MSTAGMPLSRDLFSSRTRRDTRVSIARTLRDDARLRRTAWSLSIASLQHALLVAWIASLGSFVTPPPPRLIVSLEALHAGTSMSAAAGGAAGAVGRAAVPAKVEATVATPPSAKTKPPVVVPPPSAAAPPKPVEPRVPEAEERAIPKPAETKPVEAKKTPSKTAPAKPAVVAKPVPVPSPAPGSATPGVAQAGPGTAAATGIAAVKGNGSRSGGGAADGEGSYRARIVAWLARHKRYPARARAMGLEGAVALRVTIARDGRVKARAADGASGFAVFAREAEEMVDRANPFPAVPPELEGAAFEFLVPVEFRLDAAGG